MNVNVKGERVWVLFAKAQGGMVLGLFQNVDDAKVAGRADDDDWVWVEPQLAWRHKTEELRIFQETVR